MPVVEKTEKKSLVGISDGAVNTLRSTLATKIKSTSGSSRCFENWTGTALAR